MFKAHKKAQSRYFGKGWTSCNDVLIAGVVDSESCEDWVDWYLLMESDKRFLAYVMPSPVLDSHKQTRLTTINHNCLGIIVTSRLTHLTA